MTERDEIYKTPEQEAGEFIELIQGSEFGSTVYIAASDYLDLCDLQRSLPIYQENADHPRDQKAIPYWRSEERITEMKIALLENEIRRKEVQVPGYSNVYYKIIMLDDELHDVSDEASGEFLNKVSSAVHNIRASSQPST
ncbi:MAG: hypothetical protein A2W35_02580 [Chloroflexi bacterium RBG_16_57_11]|nr:MAG: hypothetical protein A2W35_02580 [Chloroflexi bacterium RBG_16_57_11]